MKNGSFLPREEKKKKQAYYNAQVFRREDFSLHGGQGIDISTKFLFSCSLIKNTNNLSLSSLPTKTFGSCSKTFE